MTQCIACSRRELALLHVPMPTSIIGPVCLPGLVLTSLWSLETFSTVASWTCMSLRNSSAASLPPPSPPPVSAYTCSAGS